MDAIGVADRNTLAGRGADAQRREGRGDAAVDRLPARPDGRAEPARLPHRPRRLWPAVAAAEPRQDAVRQGRVRSVAGRGRGACARASPSSPGRARIWTPSPPSCRGCVRRSVAAPCRRRASLSRRRSGADRAARPAGEGHRRHHPRHQRRPLPCARQAPAAGRHDLHPREGDDSPRPASCSTPMPSGI